MLHGRLGRVECINYQVALLASLNVRATSNLDLSYLCNHACVAFSMDTFQAMFLFCFDLF